MASIAGRSTIVRTLCRASAKSTAGRASSPLGVPFLAPNLGPRRNPIAAPRFSLLRRELSSFEPLHSAIASAYLVSKLPSEAAASSQGRFANYLSPI